MLANSSALDSIIEKIDEVMAARDNAVGGEASNVVGSDEAEGKMRGVNSSKCGFTVV